MSITNNHYALRTGTGKDSRVCKVCSELKPRGPKRSKVKDPLSRSVWKCTCGITVCNPANGLSCWLWHLQQVLTQAQWGELK